MDVEVRGIADINAILRQIAPREAQNLMRATVYDIAKTGAERMIENTPDDPATGVGDLKSNIKPKRDMQAIQSRGRTKGIRVKVRTQAAAAVMITNIRRNFFWRFLELGDGPDGVEYAMALKALQSMRPEIDRLYLDAFVKKLLARLKRERRKK